MKTCGKRRKFWGTQSDEILTENKRNSAFGMSGMGLITAPFVHRLHSLTSGILSFDVILAWDEVLRAKRAHSQSNYRTAHRIYLSWRDVTVRTSQIEGIAVRRGVACKERMVVRWLRGWRLMGAIKVASFRRLQRVGFRSLRNHVSNCR